MHKTTHVLGGGILISSHYSLSAFLCIGFPGPGPMYRLNPPLIGPGASSCSASDTCRASDKLQEHYLIMDVI